MDVGFRIWANRCVFLLAPLGAFGCTAPTAVDEAADAVASDALSSSRTNGIDDERSVCIFGIALDPQGQVSSLELRGTFSVDYKIPTPGSGIYGLQRWQGALTADGNMAETGPKTHRSFLNDADIVEGRGFPIFWNNEVTDHKLIVKPSLANPSTVRYESTTKILGFIPFTVSTMTCTLGRP